MKMGLLKEGILLNRIRFIKKILFSCLFLLLLSSCNNQYSEYEDNLDHFKSLIQDINTYFIDSTLEKLEISDYYTDDFVFHSYPAGYKKGIETKKTDYIQGFQKMKQINMSIKIGHSIYLPGIDEDSYRIDGSVRVYYGATLSIDTTNVEFSAYQTVNFKKGKISEIWEWADYGGVKAQLNH